MKEAFLEKKGYKTKEDFDVTVSNKNREIDALKLFSKIIVNMLQICD